MKSQGVIQASPKCDRVVYRPSKASQEQWLCAAMRPLDMLIPTRIGIHTGRDDSVLFEVAMKIVSVPH